MVTLFTSISEMLTVKFPACGTTPYDVYYFMYISLKFSLDDYLFQEVIYQEVGCGGGGPS